MAAFNPLKFIDIFAVWLKYLYRFWELINTPMFDFMADQPFNAGFILIRTFLELVNLTDLTLLEFMLGTGLMFYVVWQLFIWFFNLIT